MGAETIFFLIFASGAVAATLGVLLSRNPINSAISLVISFFFLAGIYAMLSAHLNAIMQIMVYAGAIMVLFVFVLMLLNFGDEDAEKPVLNPTQIISMLVGVALFIALVSASLGFVDGNRRVFQPSVPPGFGGVEAIGHALMTSYVLPFEMAAVLLLVGIVGAVVIAKRRF